jgi:hypothetical protein
MNVSAQDSATATRCVPISHPGRAPRFAVIAAIAIFIGGALIRLLADSGFKGAGYDEALYRDYVLMTSEVGLMGYPGICEYYLIDQRDPQNQAKLPPTRLLFIGLGWAVKSIEFGDAPPANIMQPGGVARDPALTSLNHVCLFFSVLMVGLCGVAAWRMIGPGVGLGTMAVVAASPLGIHMGKHALVDGFFGFWATLSLWLLWENLQKPKNVRWLVALALSLALMVMAKESAIFVYIAMCGIIALNPWIKFGTVTRPLLLTGVCGPLLGVAILVVFVGGLQPFLEIFRLFITKANTLEYVIIHGDGPWYRYLLELVLFEPIVTLLALTGAFTLPRRSPAFGYLLVFVLVTYAILCNLRYGHNARFTTIWTLPFTAFAVAQIVYLTEHLRRFGRHAAVAAIALMAAYGWHQYQVYFVRAGIYDPVPSETLKATRILKPTVPAK